MSRRSPYVSLVVLGAAAILVLAGCGSGASVVAKPPLKPLPMPVSESPPKPCRFRSAGHVYWVNWGDADHPYGTVNAVPIRGGRLTTLARGQRHPISVAVDCKRVYWINSGTLTER